MSLTEERAGPDPHAEFLGQLARATRRIQGCLFALLADWNDVDDAYLRTSIVLWRKFAEFEPGTDFVRWACQVAYFEVRDLQRGRQRRADLYPWGSCDAGEAVTEA